MWLKQKSMQGCPGFGKGFEHSMGVHLVALKLQRFKLQEAWLNGLGSEAATS